MFTLIFYISNITIFLVLYFSLQNFLISKGIFKIYLNNELSMEEIINIIDNLNNLNKILQELNVNKIGTIDKERTIYVYENKYEFSFDNVESIGLFIEIEVINQIDNFEKDTYNLLNLMKELKIDLNMIERRKYIDYLVKD